MASSVIKGETVPIRSWAPPHTISGAHRGILLAPSSNGATTSLPADVDHAFVEETALAMVREGRDQRAPIPCRG